MLQLNNRLMLDLLGEIGQNLSDLGLTGEILLTGGASMCLVHSARDFTRDIDALYEPKTIINQIVSKIAMRENLPVNWLNDGVK
ncbi:MAG: hypothetical protein LBL95_07790 [Deltaproteobacteria bacterium]|nr:hypothetical protein [Deltaproteobacteria bacterium]